MLILQSKGTLALMEQWLNKKWWYTQWTGIYFYPVFDQVFENANMLTLYYFTTIKSGYRYRDAINRSFISGDKYRLWSDAFPRSPCSLSPHTSIQSVYRMVLLIWVSFFRSKKKNVRQRMSPESVAICSEKYNKENCVLTNLSSILALIGWNEQYH